MPCDDLISEAARVLRRADNRGEKGDRVEALREAITDYVLATQKGVCLRDAEAAVRRAYDRLEPVT